MRLNEIEGHESIFSVMAGYAQKPYLEQAAMLDLIYARERSGGKTISPYLIRMLESYGGVAQAMWSTVVNHLLLKYSDGWDRLWDVWVVDYNPTHNYDMVETETPNLTRTSTATTGANIYGFDSDTAVPQATGTAGATETETGTRSLTRSGNIGVTTTQQMIESEIQLRKWNVYESIFSQVDQMLTLAVYDWEEV